MAMRKGSVSGLLVTAAALASTIGLLTAVTNIVWFYPRLVTTMAVMVVALLATLLVWSFVPARWRAQGVVPALLAAVGAYTAIRIAVAAGWSEFVDHDVLEALGGEVDDVPTWLFGAIGGIGVFVALGVLRWVIRRSEVDEPL
ncbi:hypothetical protein [Geodermatophilus sp. CPCC 205761]|uniref:hypothetical protein n=1 Tax=Geodermatophilus sp. CPCC 205761 TaxID=2936597 RepID=UPI003EEE3793